MSSALSAQSTLRTGTQSLSQCHSSKRTALPRLLQMVTAGEACGKLCERNGLLWVWLSLYLSSTCQLKLFPTISLAPLCLHCTVSLPGSLHPSNAFPALPCRLRPHHTSNLQNHFFPFNVGGGDGGAEG